jgi:hypothetical protein
MGLMDFLSNLSSSVQSDLSTVEQLEAEFVRAKGDVGAAKQAVSPAVPVAPAQTAQPVPADEHTPPTPTSTPPQQV